MKKKLLSIVLPCFNEEQNVIRAYQALRHVTKTIHAYRFEFLFVDNGSVDHTREQIQKLIKQDKMVQGIILSRNFGPESSAQAGLDFARGEAVILYECDMQDPPLLIKEFIHRWECGVDIVVGMQKTIDDTYVMTWARNTFYRILKLISNIDIPINCGGFGLISRKALRAICTLPERYRFYRGLRAWVGFRTEYIPYDRMKRKYGKSSYTFLGYLRHAERSFFGFSYLPLDMLVYTGLLLTLCSFLFILVYLLFVFVWGNPIKGAVTMLVAIVFFGGLNLLALSIIGKYIQVIMEETKQRPIYIVDTIIGKHQ